MHAPGRWRDEGTSLVEYVLLIALIALAAFIGLRFFGTSRDNSLSRSASAIDSVILPLQLGLRFLF